MIPVTITPNSINLLLDGRMRTISKTHINYHAVAQCVKNLQGWKGDVNDILSDLRDLVDIPAFIARITEGRVKIGDAGVLFDETPVQGVIADRLLLMLHQGFDPRPLARFLERLKTNPVQTAIDEMYLWLESGNLPVTADGCFLAFKLVNDDFSSGHRNPDGSLLFNRPGEVVNMPGGREAVDTDRTATCSRGLHFCSWQYLPHFGINNESKRVVVLKIAPEDVVSIPHDYNNSKGRAWRYLVLQEVPKDECADLFAARSVVDSFGCYDGRDDDDDDGDDYCCGDDDDYSDYSDDEGPGDSVDEGPCDCELICQDEDECRLDDYPSDDVEAEAETFRHGRRVFTGGEVKQLVADHGQRGMARMTGVPRTTIQEWVKRLGA